MKRASEEDSVDLIGYYSPNSLLGGRVFGIDGIAPSVMSGTHGYGFGCILLYEDDNSV